MASLQPPPDLAPPATPWAGQVQAIEDRLLELDEALRGQDAARIDEATLALQKGLADALAAFRSARQAGQDPLTPDLRQKLSLAQIRLTTLQTSVHLASASMRRTLDVLFPPGADGVPVATSSAPRTVAAAALNAYRG